jgi:hypothetical protein
MELTPVMGAPPRHSARDVLLILPSVYLRTSSLQRRCEIFSSLPHQLILNFVRVSVDKLVTTAAKSLIHAHDLSRPQAKL